VKVIIRQCLRSRGTAWLHKGKALVNLLAHRHADRAVRVCHCRRSTIDRKHCPGGDDRHRLPWLTRRKRCGLETDCRLMATAVKRSIAVLKPTEEDRPEGCHACLSAAHQWPTS
jgi:hypothetical protein